MEAAHKVVRYSDTQFNKISDRKLVEKKHVVETYLKSRDTDEPIFHLYYDNYDRIDDLLINIYDANGQLLKVFKEKDVRDTRMNDGISIAHDSRVLYLFYSQSQYPFTVEYSYQKTTKNTLSVSWTPIEHGGISVERAKMSYMGELVSGSRIFIFGDSSALKIDHEFPGFSVNNYQALNQAFNDQIKVPIVTFLPDNFEFYGVKGSITNQEEFGLWVYEEMLEGRNDLPEALLNELQPKINAAQSKLEKIQIIHDYVTDNHRYVSIQLGIGGWKPFTPAHVYEKKYGDCKALSFMAQSLFEHFGIESYYTIIYRGRKVQNINPNLPSIQGNHAIVAVPREKDTLWLECTGSTPSLLTPSDISNRSCLLIKPSGGEMAQTRSYSTKENHRSSKYHLKIDSDKSAQLSIEHVCQAQRYDEGKLFQFFEENDDRLKYIRSHKLAHLPNAHNIEYDFTFSPEKTEFSERYTMDFNNYAESILEYLIIPLKIIDFNIPARQEGIRNSEFNIRYGNSDSFEYTLDLPEEYELKDTLKHTFDNAFGSISYSVRQVSKENVFYECQIVRKKARVPSSARSEFNDWVEELEKLKNINISLIKIKT